ncbi:restriction endonuclease subunit S [Photobacterium toruni]|uniref:Type-1 restriction enzyme EcoKI specificity protein n=1 Tax=Photobacterium toruni TaxID=1935446 RepID=A0A1T4UVB5_9GAMM|nr:restriction endonuclease subunit S [Photobacterium toruni]SKA56555.1 Type-1 restriction enzyme EcoKI specificity protein [Photobacterium toruni]
MSQYTNYLDFKESNIDALNQLPSHWEIKQVRYLLKDGAEGIKIGPFGSALKLEDMVESGFRVYGQENVIKKDFSLGKRQISLKKFLEMDVYRIFTNDILITMMGTSGKCEIVPEGIQEGIIDSHLLRVRVKPECIVPNFFKLLIDESPEIEYQIKTQGKGSIMHGLNSGIVKSLYLPIPPIGEQNLILAFLDHETAKIDTLIEKQQQLIELLKEKRQAVISHAVTKGLNPDVPMKDSGVEWLGEVPEHWNLPKLIHITTNIGDGLHSTPKYQDNTGYFFVNGNNLVNGKITIGATAKEVPESEYHNHYIHLDSSTVFLSINGTIGNVAKYNNEQIILGKSAAYINCTDTISPDYLMLLLRTNEYRRYFDLEVTGTTISNLSLNSIRQMKVCTPTFEEQTEIVKYCHSNEHKYNLLIESAQNAINLMQERRTALISAAVTGKIDVRNWVVPTTSSDTNEARQEVIA